MDRETEIRLARQACLGDTNAFKELEESCLPGLRNYARGLYRGNHDKAADNVNETRARALVNICRFRGDASFATWMRIISRNVFLDENRREQRHPTISLGTPLTGNPDSRTPEDFLEDDAPGPEELATQDRFCAALKECFSEFSNRDREIFRLYWCDGYTFAQIAPYFEKRTSGIHFIIHRICQKLYSCMTAKGWDSPERIRDVCLCSVEETSEVIR